MFPLVPMSKGEGGLRTGCPVGANSMTKQTHKIHLSGGWVKLEASIWQRILETSQASLWTALGVFTVQRKRIRTRSPTTKQTAATNSPCTQQPGKEMAWVSQEGTSRTMAKQGEVQVRRKWGSFSCWHRPVSQDTGSRRCQENSVVWCNEFVVGMMSSHGLLRRF